MTDDLLAGRQYLLHSKRLLLQFITAAMVMFFILMVISYSFLKNNSNYNLDRFFTQLYSHTLNMVDRYVQENKNTLETLANLPQYQEKLLFDLEFYRSSFPSDNVVNMHRLFDPYRLSEAEKLFLSEEASSQGSVVIEFISPEGIIITSDNSQSRFKPFRYFDRIMQITENGDSSGNFTITNKRPAGSIYKNTDGVVYFFTEVLQNGHILLGYLVSELNLDILTGRTPYQNQFSDTESKITDAGIYSVFEEVEQYWIDQSGRPVSSLLCSREYSEKLNLAGYKEHYSELILFDPLSERSLNAEASNIPIINELITREDEGFLRSGSAYRNYNHLNVEGGGFWLDELNLGMIIEMESSAAFRPYWSAFWLIFFIITLCFFVSLYLILWINRLRVKALDANPLTQLPGNRVINTRIQSVLAEGQAAAVVYGDLDNFKAYNDTYGFSMGDKVINFTAEVIKKVVSSYPAKDAFCGHIGGDDFIFIVPESEVDVVSEKIGQLFEQGIRSYYRLEHLEAGYIKEKNREGIIMKFPIMSFSMAGIILKRSKITHYLEVANRCSELKKLSKKTPGSTLVIDRRS